MKVLVLGGNGMAGHMIVDYFTSMGEHQVFSSCRREVYEGKLVVRVDARQKEAVKHVLYKTRPNIVINTIGLLNQNADTHLKDAIVLNALLPHWLADFSDSLGFRVLHISTDCVFSGRAGNYREQDVQDGISVYAKTKSLGEIAAPEHLTIRTSIIGPEIRQEATGLFHWFMSQAGSVSGYQCVMWNGITTLELAKQLYQLLDADINGIAHLTAPQPISKMDLLLLMKEIFCRKEVCVKADKEIRSDKTLMNSRADFSVKVPDYQEMVSELREWMVTHPHRYADIYSL